MVKKKPKNRNAESPGFVLGQTPPPLPFNQVGNLLSAMKVGKVRANAVELARLAFSELERWERDSLSAAEITVSKLPLRIQSQAGGVLGFCHSLGRLHWYESVLGCSDMPLVSDRRDFSAWCMLALELVPIPRILTFGTPSIETGHLAFALSAPLFYADRWQLTASEQEKWEFAITSFSFPSPNPSDTLVAGELSKIVLASVRFAERIGFPNMVEVMKLNPSMTADELSCWTLLFSNPKIEYAADLTLRTLLGWSGPQRHIYSEQNVAPYSSMDKSDEWVFVAPPFPSILKANVHEFLAAQNGEIGEFVPMFLMRTQGILMQWEDAVGKAQSRIGEHKDKLIRKKLEQIWMIVQACGFARIVDGVLDSNRNLRTDEVWQVLELVEFYVKVGRCALAGDGVREWCDMEILNELIWLSLPLLHDESMVLAGENAKADWLKRVSSVVVPEIPSTAVRDRIIASELRQVAAASYGAIQGFAHAIGVKPPEVSDVRSRDELMAYIETLSTLCRELATSGIQRDAATGQKVRQGGKKTAEIRAMEENEKESTFRDALHEVCMNRPELTITKARAVVAKEMKCSVRTVLRWTDGFKHPLSDRVSKK